VGLGFGEWLATEGMREEDSVGAGGGAAIERRARGVYLGLKMKRSRQGLDLVLEMEGGSNFGGRGVGGVGSGGFEAVVVLKRATRKGEGVEGPPIETEARGLSFCERLAAEGGNA